ncbi:hypothetical protein ACNHUS_25885 [Actinomycetes bacterium M1A6_2h]
MTTPERMDASCRYVRGIAAAPDSRARLLRAASLSGLRLTVSELRAMPTLTAAFTDSASGQELRSWFQDPAWRLPINSIAVSVLTLPATVDDYTRGRHRQAMRTNVRRSRNAGVVCGEIMERAERDRCVRHVLDARRTDPARLLADPTRPGLRRLITAAYDPAGDPLAYSEVVIDGPWAGVGVFVTSLSGQLSRDARYHLHAHNVSALIGRGVGHLAVGGSALLASPGTRYFQARTGFEPVRLRLRSRRRTR